MSNDLVVLNSEPVPAPYRETFENMTPMSERDAEAKAVRDNMAKLRAARLAREAAEPQRVLSGPVAPRKRKSSVTGAAAPKKASKAVAAKKVAAKTPALKDWLESQVSIGRRT
jgi:malic enzyme